MELYEYTAAKLRQKLQKRECSATEIVNSVLNRAAEVEPQILGYLSLAGEEALLTAKQVDQKIAAGEEVAPLAGIPTAVKDNICTYDVRTTAASRMLEHFIPPYDATVVKKLKAQGIPILGKTNMDEFAMGSSCENSAFQKTRNPHDVGRVPGGSSGGSAAVVSAGSAVLSLGSDTGGSIRQPAAYCGNVGLKPTYGTISRYGLIAFASSLDQIGPFGRSVEDVALLFEAVRGFDPKDATSARQEYTPIVDRLAGRLPKDLCIGVPGEYFGKGVEGKVRESVEEAIQLFEKRGAKIKAISLPSTDYALSAYYIIACAEASSNLARFDGVKYGYRAAQYDDLTSLYENTRSEGFGDEVKRRIMLGTFVLSSGHIDAYYKKAKALQRILAEEFRSAFADVDLIVTPTAPDVAFPLGERSADPLKMYASDLCTVPVSLAGLPGLSIPCGDVDGLPVGMQMIAPWFGEEGLMQAAAFFETETGGPRAVAKL